MFYNKNANLSSPPLSGRISIAQFDSCGSVTKTLLVIHNDKNQHEDVSESPTGLDGYSVEERMIKIWSPERNREDDQMAAADGAK
ncbi:hypothetical protein LINPERHAP1_LOCUS27225 [Linum perenne]